MRAISEATGIRLATVSLALQQLKEKGHIEIEGRGQSRRTYRLTHQLFQPEARGIPSCAKCKADGRVNKANLCMRCEMAQRISRAIRELGPEVSPEQIALHLNSRQIPQIRKLMAELAEPSLRKSA